VPCRRLCMNYPAAERVIMSTQLLVLAGVVIGALASYLTTTANEKARWKRTLDSRWDDRRVEAYASYAQAVKDIIRCQHESPQVEESPHTPSLFHPPEST